MWIVNTFERKYKISILLLEIIEDLSLDVAYFRNVFRKEIS